MTMEEEIRYLIVGTGRTGSSLLASILAEAGADFGDVGRDEWSRDEGAFEHPALQRACRWNARDRFLQRVQIPLVSRLATVARNRMRRDAERAFEEAKFGKTTDLVRLVQPLARHTEYEPRVIVSYRRFDEYALSRYKKSGLPFQKMKEVYLRANGTALAQLEVFGGCTVGYWELVDETETEWATAIGELTGLPATDLLPIRDEKVSEPRRSSPDLPTPGAATKLYERLRKMQGKVR